jgi:UAA transporter family.
MHSSSKPCRLIEEDKKNHDQQKKLATSTKKGGSPLLLCICASGICSCYLYFGMIQEKLFSKGSVIQESGVGNVTTFMLVLSCITNVMVAFLWTWIQDRFFTRSHHHDDGVVKKKKVDSSSVGDNDAGGELLEERKSRCHDRPLHHVMLLASELYVACN